MDGKSTQSPAHLALVEVADDGIIERLFELPLRLRALEVQLRSTLLVRPLSEKGWVCLGWWGIRMAV